MDRSEPLLFGLDRARDLGEAIARCHEGSLAPHEEKSFEDGEVKVRPLVSVRGRDVYVVSCLQPRGNGSVHDALCRLLFFVGALRDASAARITILAPYLCYARKDRRSQPRDALTLRYVAELVEAMGADRIVTLDVHNLAAYQNAFRMPTEHLEAAPLFVSYLSGLFAAGPVVVVAPDAGGLKRAERLRVRLEGALGRPCPIVFVEKHRQDGKLRGGAVVGNVEGAQAVIVDDLISTGATVARAASALRERGARRIVVAATHAVLSASAERILAEAPIERVVTTDSLPAAAELAAGGLSDKAVVLPIAPLFAEAIARLHGERSLVELVEG
jgi:ribose-phosphate pyrophosphokinase